MVDFCLFLNFLSKPFDAFIFLFVRCKVENIGKKVFCKSSGECFGYVLDVAISQSELKKVGYYVVEQKTETEFFLAKEYIIFSHDAVFVLDANDLEFVSSVPKSLIGKEVFDEKGSFYGYVLKVNFCKDKLNKLETTLCEIPCKFIKKIDGDCIFIGFSKRRNSKTSDKKLKPIVEKHAKDNAIVSIQKTPQKVNLSSNYYIGKTAKSDVFGYNNERILIRGEKITKTIFENIKKHNKINELFFLLNN